MAKRKHHRFWTWLFWWVAVQSACYGLAGWLSYRWPPQGGRYHDVLVVSVAIGYVVSFGWIPVFFIKTLSGLSKVAGDNLGKALTPLPHPEEVSASLEKSLGRPPTLEEIKNAYEIMEIGKRDAAIKSAGAFALMHGIGHGGKIL